MTRRQRGAQAVLPATLWIAGAGAIPVMHHDRSGSRAAYGHSVPARAAIANSLVRSDAPDWPFGVIASDTLFVHKCTFPGTVGRHPHAGFRLCRAISRLVLLLSFGVLWAGGHWAPWC
jgi:hypothetical protein